MSARLAPVTPVLMTGSLTPMPTTATVASTTDSKTGDVHALVTPTGTAPFCLSTELNPTSPTAAVFIWRLCVTVRMRSS